MAVLKRTEGNASCHIENRKQVFFKKSFRTLNYQHFQSNWTPIVRTKSDGKCRLQFGNQAAMRKRFKEPHEASKLPPAGSLLYDLSTNLHFVPIYDKGFSELQELQTGLSNFQIRGKSRNLELQFRN